MAFFDINSMTNRFSLVVLALLLPFRVFAQEDPEPALVDSGIDADSRMQAIRQDQTRELTVLAPTMPAQEIDRAVLNRLMQEIARDPDSVSRRLGVSDVELDHIFITVSNARSFINSNEMASIRAMCRAWNDSTLQGDGRIEAALDAYKARARFTSNFIARYYRIVLRDIEANLSEASTAMFNAYMEDRRRRMANAPTVTFGAVVENVTSGAESVQFHCRRDN